MSNINQRETSRELSMAKLIEVAKLGETLGHWTIQGKTTDGEYWRYVTIVTPDGLTFGLSGGTWNKENKIRAHVEGIKIDDNVKAYPSDVLGYRDERPSDAYIGSDKPAATIVKDIMRRVVNNPLCIDVAKKINARIEQLKASQSGLLQHIATMEKMGFTFYNPGTPKTYSVTGNHKKLYGITVYDNGSVSFETRLPIEKMPALLTLIGE